MMCPIPNPNASATTAQHGKAMTKEDEEMKVQTTSAENLENLTQEDSKRALLKPSLILTCSVIAFLARACMLACLILCFHGVGIENEGLEKRSGGAAARLVDQVTEMK